MRAPTAGPMANDALVGAGAGASAAIAAVAEAAAMRTAQTIFFISISIGIFRLMIRVFGEENGVCVVKLEERGRRR